MFLFLIEAAERLAALAARRGTAEFCNRPPAYNGGLMPTNGGQAKT